MTKPLALIILDGFGYDSHATESPWQLAEHPNFSEIEKNFPFTTLQASGLAVGLPWGKAGNSEVGHLTMGAGRIIYNHLPRIIMAIHDGSFMKNKAFLEAADHVKKNKSRLHLMGLFSSGSVHAYADHLYALMDFAKEQGVEKTYLHLFTDGRDCPPYEGAKFVKQFEERLQKYPNIKIASVIGRRFSMDRDDNWDRTEKAYNLMVEGKGKEFKFASQFIDENYKNGVSDEFVEAGFSSEGEPIQNGDAAIFFNYREDSARQITKSFVETSFEKFSRKKVADLLFVTMTQYEDDLSTLVAFSPLKVENPLAKVVSMAGLKQLHIAETEKYAHVTYFFNGGREEPFAGEERILVPSLQIPHYDDNPEMSARKITEKVLTAIDEYDFLVINFANADMVGHTGNLNACVKAIEVLDECVGKIIPKIIGKNGAVIITADHGNVEEKMYKLTGERRTNHTINPVPLYLIGEKWKREKPLEEKEISACYKRTEGVLSDVAPTIIEILGLEKPAEMTGGTLLPKLK